MSEQFTKGPWEAFTAHPDDVIDHEHSIMAGSPPRVLLLVNLAHGSKGDLRLIAAAPDLYEALKRAEFRVRFVMDVGEPHEYSEWVELHDQIEAALLKASGEPK